MKSFFILLSLYCLWAINVVGVNNAVPSLEGVEITLTGDFDIPDGLGNNHRSIPSVIPFSAFLNDDHSIDLDFYQPIGEVEIVISQNGTIIHSFRENVISPLLRNIKLQHGLSGDFLLEIKGGNGAYVFGWFKVY